MDQFDEILKERARQEPFPVPEEYSGRVLQTCAALEETDMQNHENKQKTLHSYRWAGWIAAALAVFIAVPNLSPAAAAAMRDVPVLGAIVEIVTFRDYTYDDGHSAAAVQTPELGGSAAASQVSQEVQAYTDQLIAQFKQDCETIGEGYQGLEVTSSVVTDTDAWFTLRVDATKTQASGFSFSRFYHIDKSTGQVVTFSSLFRDGADYISVLSAEVKRQMEERMAANEETVFLTEEFTAIGAEQNFYFDADGALVLVFDEYDVAPGYMGMVEFTMPEAVTKDLLK